MARQKDTPKKIKIFASLPMTVGSLFAWLCGLGIMVFWLSYSPARNASIPLTIILVLLLAPGVILIPILGASTLFATITIDITGVTKSFLGKFCKVQMTWDEIADIAFSQFLLTPYGYLWFSKTIKISYVSMERRYKVKDSIAIVLNKKRYAVIKQYIKQPITGLSEETAKALKLE